MAKLKKVEKLEKVEIEPVEEEIDVTDLVKKEKARRKVEKARAVRGEYFIKILKEIPTTQSFETYKYEGKFLVIKDGKLIGEYSEKNEADRVAKSFNATQLKAIRTSSGR